MRLFNINGSSFGIVSIKPSFIDWILNRVCIVDEKLSLVLKVAIQTSLIFKLELLTYSFSNFFSD